MTVSLAQATTIVEASLAAGRAHGLDPLTVAVLDPGGHLVCLQRQDGSGILRVEIATAKAYGALGMGFGTRELARRADKLPAFVQALTAVSQGRAVPAAGGVLIRDRDGTLLGAVGVSGDTSDNDETAVLAGIAAASLTADTGA